jgi:hypothetical protein
MLIEVGAGSLRSLAMPGRRRNRFCTDTVIGRTAPVVLYGGWLLICYTLKAQATVAYITLLAVLQKCGKGRGWR